MVPEGGAVPAGVLPGGIVPGRIVPGGVVPAGMVPAGLVPGGGLIVSPCRVATLPSRHVLLLETTGECATLQPLRRARRSGGGERPAAA
jgi:hypothetical protein